MPPYVPVYPLADLLLSYLIHPIFPNKRGYRALLFINYHYKLVDQQTRQLVDFYSSYILSITSWKFLLITERFSFSVFVSSPLSIEK